MHARSARYEVDASRMGEAEQAFRTAAGEIAKLDGFRHGVILTDNESGLIVTLTFWENRALMDASEVRAASIRQGAVKPVEGEVQRVERYEVVSEF